MFFLMGMIDKRTGKRRIMSGRRIPSVRDMQDLTDGGAPKEMLDWGFDASPDALLRTSRLILGAITNRDTAHRLADEFADDVVSVMDTDRMWLLDYGEITSWLQQRQLVA